MTCDERRIKEINLIVPDRTGVIFVSIVYMNDDNKLMVTSSVITNGDRRIRIGNGEPWYVPDIYDLNRGEDNDI